MGYLEQAQDAMARHSWTEAFEILTEADAKAGIGPEALEILGDVFFWLGRIDDRINARERAYAGYLEAASEQKAGLMCLRLAEDHFHRQADSVGRGWLSRAERLLAENTNSVEYGWLARLKAVIAEGRGDIDEALNLAKITYETATRMGDRDLQVLSLHDQGRAMVAKNLVDEGMELMEEAMIKGVADSFEVVAVDWQSSNVSDF